MDVVSEFGSICREKVALTALVRATPMVLAAGEVDVTVGAAGVPFRPA